MLSLRAQRSEAKQSHERQSIFIMKLWCELWKYWYPWDCFVAEAPRNDSKSLNSVYKKQLIFAGAESHICMLQSAFNLRLLGYEIFFISDVISARSSVDNEAAKSRLSDHNYPLITKEMLFFELIEHSELSHYLDLSLKFLDGRYIKHKGISTCLLNGVQTV